MLLVKVVGCYQICGWFIKDAPMFNLARKTVSDFAVPLALLVTTLTDYYVGVPTPKLQVRQASIYNVYWQKHSGLRTPNDTSHEHLLRL